MEKGLVKIHEYQWKIFIQYRDDLKNAISNFWILPVVRRFAYK